MITRIRGWYGRLSDQWRATLRTAWQSFVGVVITFLIGLLAVATDVINGGALDDAIADTSNLARLAVAAIISILSSVLAFGMNRPSAKAPASYPPPPPVQ